MRQVLTIALALLSFAPPLPAQDAEYQVEIDPRSVFSAVRDQGGRRARVVSLQFQIKRLRDAAVVTDVPRQEILVEEDGKAVAGLEVFQPKSQKLTVVLALDVSGSMARGRKMDEAKQAAEAFLDRLDERAGVGLILFDHEVKAALPPGPKDRLRPAIRAARPQGGTAYLDAAVRAVEMLRGVEGRRVVVVLTDGVDMNSRARLEEAIQVCQAVEVPVYTVGIGEPGKDEPVTTVLVLDHSGSMMMKADANDDGSKLDALKRAATRFVELMRPNSRTTLLPFSDRPGRAEPFSNDRALLTRRIQSLRPHGGTALYEATYQGVETLEAGEVRGRRAVIVLTDGRDESAGRHRSEDDVIERARQAKVPLYMLGLGQPEDVAEDVMRQMASRTGGEYYHAGNRARLVEVFESLSIQLHDDGIDERSLGEMAAKTGGRYTHVSQASELSVFYERLADELQTTYRATFESRRPSHDGTARGLDVKVTRGGRVVSTGGQAEDVARGVAVPQMSYGVYLGFLALLGALLAAPALARRLFRGAGGV
ncbi:MAG: VWA domain-containing protein [Gemmataceae bacterium]